MKLIALGMLILVGGLLMGSTADFPAWGDPASPAASYLSPNYIEKTMEETSVPNIVTSVLADYRGFDTMFETAVVFTAGVACFFLLRAAGGDDRRERAFRHRATGVVLNVDESFSGNMDPNFFREIDTLWAPNDPIIETVGRILAPFIQVFGLYVIAHGHYSPGGGFQGGVILGASIILLALCYDLRFARNRLKERLNSILSAVGVLIYAGVGAACLAFGANFLDYSALSPILSVDPIHARSLGIFFVEVGVGLAVMATMILIYANLASAGSYRQGL